MDVIWNVGNKELFVRKISVVKMMRNVSKKIKKVRYTGLLATVTDIRRIKFLKIFMTDVEKRGECQVLDNEVLQGCFQPIWLFEDKQRLTN